MILLLVAAPVDPWDALRVLLFLAFWRGAYLALRSVWREVSSDNYRGPDWR